MKHKVIFSIALAASLLLVSMFKADSTTVRAEPPQRFTWSTGLLKLGPGQVLRIAADNTDRDDPIIVVFRRQSYMQTGCSDGICKQVMSDQSSSAPVALGPNESAVVDAADYVVWRSVSVVSNSPNVQVTASIVDSATGQTTSVLIALLLP